MSTSILTGLVPRLRAEKISWRIVGAFLEVQIDLDNPSSEPTEQTQLVVEVAAFGAFVPFKPGTRILVTGLDPWEERRVTAMIPAERLQAPPALPLGRAPDDIFQTYVDFRRSGGRWAGNLNVHFDRAPEKNVELHRALDLKLQAGVPAAFVFAMDSTRGYTLEAKSSNSGWTAEPRAMGLGVLLVTPPAQVASRATIEVLVTRFSDGKTVPVVFGLETVAGAGGTLGCVRV